MHQRNVHNAMEPAQLDTVLPFDLPADWLVDVARPEPVTALSAPRASIAAALADPLHSAPLSELAGRGDQVCIVFTPPGIPCPEHMLVPALLHELERAGVYDQDITLLCASGIHGRTSPQQHAARLGAEVMERYRVLDHDVGEVIHLGQWRGIPLTVNRHTLEANLLISTGVVAPHLYAGYSGGSGTLAIGCAGDVTTEALYTPSFLHHSYVRPGQVRGNPFQEVMQSLAHRVGLRFILNVILAPTGEIVDVQAGDPFLVHQYMVFSAASLYDTAVFKTYDVVIASIDPPHDSTLYQAILGALLVGLAPRPVVRPGGAILLPARTPEAVGQGSNAQSFYHALQGVRSPEALMTERWERSCRPGEARALQLTRLLQQNEVVVVGSEFPALVEACHMQAATDMEAAFDLVRWLLGDDLKILVVPHALHTIPLLPVPEQSDQITSFQAGMWAW